MTFGISGSEWIQGVEMATQRIANVNNNGGFTRCRRIFLFFTLVLIFSIQIQKVFAQSQEIVESKYWIFLHADSTVDDTRVDRLREFGVVPVHRSLWLNAVSAYIPTHLLASVTSLASVDRITPVAWSRNAADLSSLPSFERFISLTGSNPPFLPISVRFDYGTSQVQLEKSNILPNLDQGINGTGVRLGIIDTGIGDLDHAAFDLMKSEGRFIETRDFTGQPDDGNRHAQYVLSVVAGYLEGQIVGPAYGAQVLHARAEVTTSETRQEEDNLVAALEWMTAEGVDVINISLSYTEFDLAEGDYTYADMNGLSAIGTLAADMAVQSGVVVVTSAGNSAAFPGSSEPCPPDKCWYHIGSPADAFDVITVGATTVNDEKAVFSSFGPTFDGRTKPDISAMGVGITYARNSINASCNGIVCTNGSGTSFSSPLVAGIVAQMLQVNPTLTPFEVRRIIRQTARVPKTGSASGADYPNNSLGWGIVDAAAAVAVATSIGSDPRIPNQVVISDPFPNPANGRVQFFIFGGELEGKIRFELVDLLGRRVSLISVDPRSGNTNRLTISTKEMTPGVYLYRISNSKVLTTGKIVIVR